MAGDEQTNGHGTSRLDRLEGLMELLIEDHLKFRDEHKLLLTAQIVLTERVDKLALNMQELHEAQRRTDEQIRELREAQIHTDERLKELARESAESQKHTDDRLNALINVVDDIVRKRPPQAP